MSTVRDSDGNILNQPPDYVKQHNYKGKHSDTIDWFDTHPKPSVVPSETDLDAVAAEQDAASATSGDQPSEVPQGSPSGEGIAE